MTDIEQIRSLAEKAGKNYDAATAAFMEENEARAAVLTAAINAALPGLRAVSSRLVRRDHSTNGANGCNPAGFVEHFGERGLTLIDEVEREKDATGNSGSYIGTRLVLLTDGSLVELQASGSWSFWQGSWDRLDLSMETISPVEAAVRYDLDAAIEALTEALRKQAEGANPKRAKAAMDRAKRLRAVADLVGS